MFDMAAPFADTKSHGREAAWPHSHETTASTNVVPRPASLGGKSFKDMQDFIHIHALQIADSYVD